MLEIYCNGTVTIGGSDYPAEVGYEMDEGQPDIHYVYALQEVAKLGEVWYDGDGNAHWGPHWLKLDVTDWTPLWAWAEEITAYAEYIEGLRTNYRRAADELSEGGVMRAETMREALKLGAGRRQAIPFAPLVRRVDLLAAAALIVFAVGVVAGMLMS